MKKIFLDTNILLDFGQNREQFRYAETILQLGKNNEIELCASYLSYANMGYILRKMQQCDKYALMRKMRQNINVLPCDSEQLDLGLSNETKDFEDMLQYQCAMASDCEIIVTNNETDYTDFSQIPVMSSKEFLLYYFRQKEEEDK